MINIIYGAKGTGKTKIIIDMANDALIHAKGDIVFLTDTNRYVHDVKYQARFVNTKDSNIVSEDGLIGFIQGMLSANYDIKTMFIDGTHRMIGLEVAELSSFFDRLEKIATLSNIDFTLTISKSLDDMPEFIKKYIK